MKSVSPFAIFFIGCLLVGSVVAVDQPAQVVPRVKKIETAEIEESRARWPFLPVEKTKPPQFAVDSRSRQAMDQFVFAKLQQAGLQPNPQADKRTLIRRASFDLIGLSPTFEDVESFVNDASPDAFAKVVDRLLSSPLHGQRWGRHWLDVARYSDTREESTDSERRFPFAYTYRDYVINAFNLDKPFDQFVIEQIAADRMKSVPRESLAALGFLTVGRRFQGNADAANLVIDDRIDVVTRGFLGLTGACARCHDHKFDPIPTADYYSLYGILASMEEPLDKPELRCSADDEVVKNHLAERDKMLREVVTHVDSVLAAANQRMRNFPVEHLQFVVNSSPRHRITTGDIPLDTPRGLLTPGAPARWEKLLEQSEQTHEPFFALWHKLILLPRIGFAEKAKSVIANAHDFHPWVAQAFAEHNLASMLDAAETYGHLVERALKENSTEANAIRDLVYGASSPVPIARVEIEEDLGRFLTDRRLTQRSEIARAGEIRGKLDALETTSPVQRAMSVVATALPVNPHVLVRGNAKQPGDAVPRRFPQVLSNVDARAYADDGRLELAQAIANLKNPLTARVIVNRVWQQHFGQGIVTTADNFGAMGAPPTHPELLDHLAWWFMEHGWSLKALHRYILLSSTWQQSSHARADAMEKDAANQWLWRMNPRRLEFEPMRDAMLEIAGRLDARFGGVSEPMTGNSTRRAVYNFTDRFRIPALLRNFDVANPDTSIARRSETLVPQQSLFLMNSAFVREQAAAFIRRVEFVRAADDETRIKTIYQLAYARLPDAEELQWCAEFVHGATNAGEAVKQWVNLAQALLLANEFVFVN